MIENVLETLLLVAYLCIALISVVIAVYAIGVSYQGRETQRSKWRKKRRREVLEKKIKELGSKVDVEGISQEIERYKKEIAEIDGQLFYLSVWGTVVVPITCYLSALIMIVYIICANPTEIIELWGGILPIENLIVGGAIIAIGFGIFFQLKTLFAIEWAASRIPLPQFEIGFEKQIKTLKCKAKEQKEVVFMFGNNGEDIAENLQIFVMFPPSFTVHKKREYSVVKQGTETDYFDYNAAIIWIDLLHVDTTVSNGILLTMPDVEDAYEVPVIIYERKIGAHKDKLVIEIVEQE